MEFATISTIDLQRLEKALTPLGGSFRYSAIYKNFIQTEGKKNNASLWVDLFEEV